MDRRAFLRRSGLVAGSLAWARWHCRSPACAMRKRALRLVSARRPPSARASARFVGRLHRGGGSRQRRVDRPGTRLGFAAQPRLALRQRRRSTRSRASATPIEISDEALQRPLDPRELGDSHRRDRREARGNSRKIGSGCRLLARLRQDSPTRELICSANSRRSGVPTTLIIAPASAIPQPSPVSPIPGATAR